ncbi:MAG: redoxin domain-containing protein [Pseudoxanthomonas sp.]
MTAVHAPDFPHGLHWLNAAPIALRALEGSAVALAFVDPASSWCMQRLADLAPLQRRYSGRLHVLVLAVPRFDAHRDPSAVLKRLRRHGVSFPIVHDLDWHVWQRFGIESWPTIVLIDPQGRMVDRIVGTPGVGALEAGISALCDPLPEPLEDVRLNETQPEPRTALRFPTGLVATADRLYVADSGHHQVLECNHAGRVLRRFGNGTADALDGGSEIASFCRPNGLSLLRESLFVADTGNHLVRRIELRSGNVQTVLGNRRAAMPSEGPIRSLQDVSLPSPTALVAGNSGIHMTLAGDNRVWTWNQAEGLGVLECRAGSGQLGQRDGAGILASFAQPSGLAQVQQALYVTDTLASSIRGVQLRGDLTQTLVGSGMWEFGDADGQRQQARLQAPEALALDPDSPLLWIADTGNGCIRSLRLGGGVVTRLDLRRLAGPAGIAAFGGKLWISETDAHAVLCLDLASNSLTQVPIDE